MAETPQAALQIRRVRFRKARIDHYLTRGRVIKRYVILESHSLRELLEKQRRTEIDPLDLGDIDDQMTLHDVWEMATRTAKAMLRELYGKVAMANEAKRVLVLENQRLDTERKLGQQLVPLAIKSEVSGSLIFAGMRPGIPYCVEVLTDNGEVRRVVGIDLARALDVSKASVGDAICVAKVAKHNVQVTEERTGSHGTGKRTSQQSRVVFEITTKEASHDPAYGTTEHGPHSEQRAVNM